MTRMSQPFFPHANTFHQGSALEGHFQYKYSCMPNLLNTNPTICISSQHITITPLISYIAHHDSHQLSGSLPPDQRFPALLSSRWSPPLLRPLLHHGATRCTLHIYPPHLLRHLRLHHE